MSEQVIMDIRRRQARCFQIIKTHDNTDRDGVFIGVHESSTCNALRRIPNHGVGCTAVITHIEAIFKDFFGKSDHRLHTHCKVFLRLFSADSRLLGNERVHPICGNHNVGAQLIFSGTNTNNLSVFDDEGVNLHTRHHGDTGFLALLAQPQIKLCTQHCDCIGGLSKTLIPVVNVDR